MIEKMIIHLEKKLKKARLNIERWAELNEPEISERQIRKSMNKISGMQAALYPIQDECEKAKRLLHEMTEVWNIAARWLNGDEK